MKNYIFYWKYVALTGVVALFANSLVVAKDYIPLLEEGKEWGYVDYLTFGHPNETFSFMRLACGDKTTIDDKTYFQICQYKSYLRPENAQVVAYMREESGKVYVRYPYYNEREDYNYFIFVEGYINHPDSIGEEVLLYDFSMNEGETLELFSYMNGPMKLKCIETGHIDYEGTSRKYLKFDKTVTDASNFWMAFDYIVEGIGPIGNCTFTVPFRANPYTGQYNNFSQKRLLYQRELPVSSDPDEVRQGNILFKSPHFDVFGICDPAIYYWNDTNGKTIQPDTCGFKSEDMNIKLVNNCIDGNSNIVCKNEILTRITVYNPIGQVIKSFTPLANEFLVEYVPYNYGIIVIKAETENYTRSFILW